MRNIVKKAALSVGMSMFVSLGALAAGDTDYVAAMPVRVAASSPCYVGAMADWLLAQSDVSGALKKAQAIETYYITSGREVPSKLKAVLTALTRRLVTSKM